MIFEYLNYGGEETFIVVDKITSVSKTEDAVNVYTIGDSDPYYVYSQYNNNRPTAEIYGEIKGLLSKTTKVGASYL